MVQGPADVGQTSSEEQQALPSDTAEVVQQESSGPVHESPASIEPAQSEAAPSDTAMHRSELNTALDPRFAGGEQILSEEQQTGGRGHAESADFDTQAVTDGNSGQSGPQAAQSGVYHTERGAITAPGFNSVQGPSALRPVGTDEVIIRTHGKRPSSTAAKIARPTSGSIGGDVEQDQIERLVGRPTEMVTPVSQRNVHPMQTPSSVELRKEIDNTDERINGKIKAAREALDDEEALMEWAKDPAMALREHVRPRDLNVPQAMRLCTRYERSAVANVLLRRQQKRNELEQVNDVEDAYYEEVMSLDKQFKEQEKLKSQYRKAQAAEEAEAQREAEVAAQAEKKTLAKGKQPQTPTPAPSSVSNVQKKLEQAEKRVFNMKKNLANLEKQLKTSIDALNQVMDELGQARADVQRKQESVNAFKDKIARREEEVEALKLELGQVGGGS